MIFRPNPALIAELEAEGVVDALAHSAAEAAKEEAEAIAPRGETGRYTDSFVVTKSDAGWALGNTDFAAHWVEWGSVNNPPYAPLRRAVQATGLHLREAPKP